MDIIQELYKIGNTYKDNSKNEFNALKSYKDNISINIYGVELKSEDMQLSPNSGNCESENFKDIVIARMQESSSAKGNLFPVNNLMGLFDKKALKIEKFIKGLKTSVKNSEEVFLKSGIEDEIISEIIELMKDFDYDKLFEVLINNSETISSNINAKSKSFLTFTYYGKFITYYLQELFDYKVASNFIKDDSSVKREFTHFLSNEVGVSATFDTPFTSQNELANNQQDWFKVKSIATSGFEAGMINLGYKILLNNFSFYWGGIQTALIPITFNLNSEEQKQVYSMLAKRISLQKGTIETDSKIEHKLNAFIERFVDDIQKSPVLCSFLFYNQSNAKNDLLLQVDDVMPSYISKIAKILEKNNVNAIPQKGDKGKFYLTNLFNTNIEFFNFILSNEKMNRVKFLKTINELIIFGGKEKLHITQWDKYFNGYYSHGTSRQTGGVYKVSKIFFELGKVDIKIFKKENIVLDKKYKEYGNDEFLSYIEERKENIELINNNLSELSFYVGVLSSMIIRRQIVESSAGNSVLARWLGSRQIRNEVQLKTVVSKIKDSLIKINAFYKGGVGEKATLINEKVSELISSKLPQNINGDEINICFAIGGESLIEKKTEKLTKEEK